MGRRKRPVLKDISIFGIADKGMSVGKTPEGEVCFVEGAVPGDIVDVQQLRKKKGLKFGKAIAFNKLSEHRVDPQCEHFGVCGGCKWQNLDYAEQLKQKQKVVHDALTRIGKVEGAKEIDILGADEIYNYRNKMEFSFSNKRWLTEEEIDTDDEFKNRNALGFHRPGAFDKIVDVHNCHLQGDPSNEIRNWVRSYANENDLTFYNIKEHTGIFRNIIIRLTTLNELMVVVIFGENEPEVIAKTLHDLADAFPQVNSLQYIVNLKKNDSLQDQEVILFKGSTTIREKLGHVFFDISAKSFFQTNSRQGKRLYDVIVDFCGLNGGENIYDLYTGLGSIASYVAHKAKKVVAIEEVEVAIKDAKHNAAINNLDNMEFYCGDVKDILTPEFHEKHGQPDIIITDPPRAGMHEDVVNMLLAIAAPKLVYVSCNPATQGRDVALLAKKYDVVQFQGVDMFPHTHHVESVTLLTLKK